MLIHGATDNDIYPAVFGASQRSFGLFRGLARRHQVTALCVVPNRSRAPREQRAAGVTLLRRKAWYTSLAWRLERARLAPLFLAAHAHRASSRRLLGALRGPAEVFAADLNLTGLFDRHPAPLKIYTSHNVEFDHFRMVKSRVAAPAHWAERIRRLEERAVLAAGLTVVCGDEDARRMTELYGVTPDRLVVIPNGYDETLVRPPSPEERLRSRAALGLTHAEYACAFVGSDFPPNRAALALLVERVFPRLAAAGGFRLLVAGTISRRLEGRSEPWLIVRPEMADLSPVLHAADAGLNPVLTGGGSNVKLPTCLAAGLAVVTTPFGLRGYAPLAPHVTVADPESLAEALRARPAGWAARGLTPPPAVATYAWGRLGEQLGERLVERLGGASAPRTREARA